MIEQILVFTKQPFMLFHLPMYSVSLGMLRASDCINNAKELHLNK